MEPMLTEVAMRALEDATLALVGDAKALARGQ